MPPRKKTTISVAGAPSTAKPVEPASSPEPPEPPEPLTADASDSDNEDAENPYSDMSLSRKISDANEHARKLIATGLTRGATRRTRGGQFGGRARISATLSRASNPSDGTHVSMVHENPREFMQEHIMTVARKYDDFRKIPQERQQTIVRRLERACFNASTEYCISKYIVCNWTNKRYVDRYSAECYRVLSNLDTTGVVGSTHLIRQLIDGTIDPKNIANVSSECMCPEASQTERDNIHVRIMQKIDVKYSDKYQCKKCFSRKTRYREIQMRALDEPANLSFVCVDCGFTWVR